MTPRTRLRALLAVTLFVGFGTCSTTNCCDELRKATSRDNVLTPLSPDYGPENSKYWSSTCVLEPWCIFTPTSASDVSAAVKIFTRKGCQFAVRGGGHTPNPGWAGTSSGVLISLSKLNTIQVSDDAKSVIIGAGNRWGDVYAETGKRGVTVAGGRMSPVGVSGFLLGGGLSYLMHQVGFAANSVLSYEMVLANGTISNVTEASASDLFKALKGGSGNFGIVTSFHLQTHPVDQVYAGNLYYAPAQFDSLFPLMEAYAREGTESDPKTHVIAAFVNIPSRLLNMATFYGFHSDPVTSPPPAMKPFVEVPTMVNTLNVKTVKDAADELSVGTVNGLRYDLRDYSIRADAGLYKQLRQLWDATTTGLNSTSGFMSAIAFQPVSDSMIRASDERGGNVLGLQAMDDPLIIVNYQFTWALSADDKKVYATIDKLMKESKKIAKSQGKLADYIYLNYASTGQKVFESYGQPQVDFLKSVKAKYDPKGVFTKLSPAGSRFLCNSITERRVYLSH